MKKKAPQRKISDIFLLDALKHLKWDVLPKDK